MWVDLRPLMKGTDISLNMSLHRNDLLFVPDPDDELVYVMGQVKNPGPYPLTANMSFLEALTRAGGPNDNAQQGKIVLARPSKNTEQIVDLGERYSKIRNQLSARTRRYRIRAQERIGQAWISSCNRLTQSRQWRFSQPRCSK